MTPQQIEALKLALEALETADETDFWNKQKQAITAIKETLAEHAMRETQRLGQEIEQEPVAYATKEDFYRELMRRLKHIREEMKIKSVTMRCKDYDIALPIIDTDFGRVLVGQVYTPPHRKPLTDEEIVAKALHLSGLGTSPDVLQFARAIEAAHGIKENT